MATAVHNKVVGQDNTKKDLDALLLYTGEGVREGNQ